MDPIAAFEYQLTDEQAARAALSMLEMQTQRVGALTARSGLPHPALPLVAVSSMLVVGISLVLVWDAHLLVSRVLAGVGCVVLLLLIFKLFLYFVPPFARWYARTVAVRGLRNLAHRTISWSFHEDRFETRSATTRRSVTWTDLRAVQVLPQFWFLTLGNGARLLIPVAAMAPDVRALIRRKALEAGVVVEERAQQDDAPAGRGSATGTRDCS